VKGKNSTERYLKKDSIVLLLPSLSAGGAERTTIVLANKLEASAQVYLAVISNHGGLSDMIAPNVRVVNLGGKVQWLYRLPFLLWRIQPVSLMSTAWDVNLLVVLLRGFFPWKTRVVIREPVFAGTFLDESRLPAFYALLYRHLYRLADRVIVLSHSMKTAIVSRTRVKEESVSVIYNSVHQDRYQLNGNRRDVVQEFQKIIVVVGRLEYQKGYDILIRAFSNIVDKYPGYRLLIIGTGARRIELNELVKKLGMQQKVEFAGHLENPLLLVRRAALFILSSRYEGVSNAMIESLCVGVPVLAVEENTSAGEFINEGVNGFLVPHANMPDLSVAMRNALKHVGNIDRAQVAKDARDKFSVQRMVEAYKKVLLH